MAKRVELLESFAYFQNFIITFNYKTQQFLCTSVLNQFFLTTPVSKTESQFSNRPLNRVDQPHIDSKMCICTHVHARFLTILFHFSSPCLFSTFPHLLPGSLSETCLTCWRRRRCFDLTLGLFGTFTRGCWRPLWAPLRSGFVDCGVRSSSQHAHLEYKPGAHL